MFNSWRLNRFRMNTEELLLKDCRMSFCHRKLSSFEGSKRLKHRLFACNRKRKHVLKLQHMVRHMLLKMLPEWLRRLQKPMLRLKPWHKQKLMLKPRHRHNRLQHRLDSWISTWRLSDSKGFLQAERPIKSHLVIILLVP